MPLINSQEKKRDVTDPPTSIRGLNAINEATQVTNSAVTRESAQEVVSGPGTFQQARDAAIIERETGRELPGQNFFADMVSDSISFFTENERQGDPVSKEEFNKLQEQGEINTGLDYLPGETTLSVERRSALADEQDETDAILSRATAGQSVLSIGTMIPASFADPVNLGSALLTGGAVGGTLRGLKSLRKIREIQRLQKSGSRAQDSFNTASKFDDVSGIKTGSIGRVNRNLGEVKKLRRSHIKTGARELSLSGKQQVLRNLGEGAASSAFPIAIALGNSESLGQRYTAKDAGVEFTVSALLSGGLSAVNAGVGKKMRALESERINKQLERQREVEGKIDELKKFNSRISDTVALAQIRNGEIPDTREVDSFLNAEQRHELTTLGPTEITNPRVIESEDGFIAIQPNENGLMVGTTGRGETADEARRDLISRYDNPRVRDLYSNNIEDEYVDVLREADRLNREVDEFDFVGELLSAFSSAGGDEASVRPALQRQQEISQRLERNRNQVEAFRKQLETRDQLTSESRSLSGQASQITKQIKQFRKNSLSGLGQTLDDFIQTSRDLEEFRVRITEAREKRNAFAELEQEANRLNGQAEQQFRALRQKNPDSIPELDQLLELQNNRAEIREQAEVVKARRDRIKATPKKIRDLETKIEADQRTLRDEVDPEVSRVLQNNPDLEDASVRVQQRLDELVSRRDALNDQQIQMQRRAGLEDIRQFLLRGETRRAGDARDATGPAPDQEKAIQADPSEAPRADVQERAAPTEERSELEEMLEQSETRLNGDENRMIQQAIEEADRERTLASDLRQLKDCLGK